MSRAWSISLAVLMTLTAGAADYLRDIKPVLKARCYACHGALKQKSGLRVDTAANIRKGAKGEAIVAPGKPTDSELLYRLTTKDLDDRMPPEGAALKVDEIAVIKEWIAAGAPVPKGETAEAAPREHWAFQVPKKMQRSGDSGNLIDGLLEDRRVALGLKTQPEAERTILIRRLYLDLIGLPPTRAQLADQRPWNEIVDELLNNPQHGERWARHWMDIWRYADWYGLGAQLRNSQKHIWHWRDWIVESLNQDKGYDRMILEMLAADELAPEDPKALRATGFLARNYYLFNRTTWLDATIEHTGKAFLGLTLNCAKCHDHKYDPITHADYYRFRAIFEPHQVRLDPVPGVTDFEKDGLPRVFDNHLDIKTYLHLRGDPKNPDTNRVMQAGVPAVLSSFAPKIKSVQLPVYAYAPAARDYVRTTHLALARAAVGAAQKELAEARKKAANAPKEKPNPNPKPPLPTPKFAVKDDFSKLNAELWEVVGKGWKFKDGAAHQTIATLETERLVLRPKMPRDFELTCRYTHTGGNTYKSVTFRFDVSPDRKYANFVYTSAHAPRPKLHVAYTRGGASTYPPDGLVAQPIAIGKPYTLRLAVRDRLVNVWLNGKFQIAYTLPDRKPGGRLELSGFDATVAFDDVSIAALPAGVKLAESKNKASELKAASSVEIVEAKLAAAETKVDSLEAMFAAAKLGKGTPLRAAKKALETPAHKETQYPTVYPVTSTGRRSGLAHWITSPKNPLTARVAVNHVWLRHFGEPLVESVDDFGLRAKRPVQAELLDTLAVEFMESGWSFRHLHRLIVTSRTYRLSSTTAGADPKTLAADPNNHFYWRMNTRRMEAQVVRDSLLHLAGVLDPKMGGPSINPSNAVRRRSLYFKHSRDQQNKFLKMFNDADHLQCYRRTESIVPQQALALANSKLAIEMSGLIAKEIEGEGFVEAAFVILLGRKPDSAERQECQKTLGELEAEAIKAKMVKPTQRARRGLVHALLNHNDFVSVR